MSKPGTIYQSITKPFKEADDTQLFVDISDNDNLVADDFEVSIISMIPFAQHFSLSIINNSEDPFTVIKSQQAVIKILTTSLINLNTFCSGSDQRWSVHAYLDNDNTKTVFKGFLSMSDISEKFMPHPNILTLTATDNLGVLKDIPLTKPDGTVPTGYNKISSYIAWALAKTGLSLSCLVSFNIRLNGSTGHLFNEAYLEAKTFEDEVGTRINCYRVLEIILGEEAFLIQRQGKWYIVRVDEMQGSGLYFGTFSSLGVYANDLTLLSINKEIGKDTYDIFFSKEATDVLQDRPLASDKLIYNYNYPRELPCNNDFSRGDLTDGTNPLSKKYNVECWDQLWSNTTTDDPQTTGIYIRRVFNANSYEVERYVVLEANAPRFTFIMSEAIPVNAKDKFSLSVQRRLSADVGGTGFYRDDHVQVRLYGNDGTFWTHQSPTSASVEKKWVACDSTFRTFQKFFSIEGDVTNDLTESASLYDGDSAEIPVAGTIKILFYRSSLYGDTLDTYFTFTFDYLAYINGSYAKYTGQSQTVTQTGGYKETREREVFMAESPNPNFKGAIFYLDTTYKLAQDFYNGATAPAGPPSADYVHPYSEIQVYDNWNQFNNGKRVFQFTAQGIDIGIDANFLPSNAGPVHTFFLQDTNGSTTNKRFILLSMNQDWRNGEWNGTLREVYDVLREKVYIGRVFKYLT